MPNHLAALGCPGVAVCLSVAAVIEVPKSFRDMPRWWRDGRRWLDSLPGLVQEQLVRWRLTVDGSILHGSNAIVIPVRRDDQELILRMTPPGDGFQAEVAALHFWNGRGTVLLYDTDTSTGAMLLERLDLSVSADALPLVQAFPVAAQMMRRLALPVPPTVRRTSDIAQQRLAELQADWLRLNRPFSVNVLDAAQKAAEKLIRPTSDTAVNGDLHFGQVLRGTREDWLCVDPLLLRGDIEYDLARLLWSRLDEMSDDEEVLRCFEMAVIAAELDEKRARLWVVFRTIDYWLWGLNSGLTDDPARCARLSRVFLD
jgi:streptomycin 6-kinase